MIRINAVVNREYITSLVEKLFFNGIRAVYIENGRANMLKDKKAIFSIDDKKKLINDPFEVLNFFVSPKEEINALKLIDDELNFATPGKGSVYSSESGILRQHDDIIRNSDFRYEHDGTFVPHSDLSGISCIVQRGHGDEIAYLVLDSGISVPVLTYGSGTGFRDKLGLLRITIPAEKEIITLMMSKYDVEAVMELMIIKGKLSQPGKGFIYDFPVRYGFVNTKISTGASGQVASQEQIISAIDSLKGGIGWRKSKVDRIASANLNYLKDLTELNLVCNEGYGADLVKVAMQNGASGATLSAMKFKGNGEAAARFLPSLEICRMIVAKQSVEPIAAALEGEGAFGANSQGFLFTQKVKKAYTYSN